MSDTMKIDFIGIPIFYGSDRPGVEDGPAKLREHGIQAIFEKHGHIVNDLGDVTVAVLKVEDKYTGHEKMKYYDAVVKANYELAEKVNQSIAKGNLPLIIGGDHSLGLGSVSGASTKDFGVIWIDAHGDINTDAVSPSGNMHGMPLASMMGLGDRNLTEIFTKEQKVKPENVFLLAQRDIDDGEYALITEEKLKLWTTEQMQKIGMDATIDAVEKSLEERKIQNVHLSFDIDALDSALVPGTGTPVEKGLTIAEVDVLFKRLLGTDKIKSIDFAEFNPQRDTEGAITLDTCLKVLDSIAKYLK